MKGSNVVFEKLSEDRSDSEVRAVDIDCTSEKTDDTAVDTVDTFDKEDTTEVLE